MSALDSVVTTRPDGTVTVAFGRASAGIALEVEQADGTIAALVIPHWDARRIARALNRAAKQTQETWRASKM